MRKLIVFQQVSLDGYFVDRNGDMIGQKSFSVPEMPRGEDAIFRYELTPQEGYTLLTVTYRHIAKQTAYGFAPGTHVLLDRLEAQLNKEPLPDWMTRFTEARRLYPGWSK